MWNEAALVCSKDIILCESLIDTLTFWCAGFRNVTASYGVSGFTDDHRRAFEKHGTQRIYIAYDRDEAGDKAAATLADELMGMGIECYRVLFPKGMDANEYALKVTPADRSLGVLLNKAQWLGKGAAPKPVPVPQHIEQPAAKEEIKEVIEQQPEPEPEPVPSLAAVPSPAPARHEIDVPVEVRGEDVFLKQGDRTYRVRGLQKNMSYELLRVNVLVSGTTPRGEQAFHIDTLDLYSSRQRTLFTKQASEELCIKEDVLRRDLWAGCC